VLTLPAVIELMATPLSATSLSYLRGTASVLLVIEHLASSEYGMQTMCAFID
jgi:hypothetical protein